MTRQATPAQRRRLGFAFVCALLSPLVSADGAAAARPDVPPPVLPTENSDVATLGPMAPHWVLAQALPGGMTLYDADARRILAGLPANFTANAAIAPDRSRFLVAETIWSEDDHGVRQDMLAEYDAHTMSLSREIKLPPRALAVFKAQDLAVSGDGTHAYVFDLRPSASVTVVDLRTNAVSAEIDTPGCALVFPWPGGFSSLCGDGSLLSVALPGAGRVPVSSHGPHFFDAVNNPVFESSLGDARSGQALFLTYSGQVFPVVLGVTPRIGSPWSLQQAAGQPEAGVGAQELAWRPGGVQVMAWHPASHRLFVLMHPGVYWTQKQAGTEVWVFDTEAHRLLRRIPLKVPAKGVAVSQDGKPLLFAASGDGELATLSPETGETLHDEKFSGGGPLLLTPPGP